MVLMFVGSRSAAQQIFIAKSPEGFYGGSSNILRLGSDTFIHQYNLFDTVKLKQVLSSITLYNEQGDKLQEVNSTFSEDPAAFYQRLGLLPSGQILGASIRDSLLVLRILDRSFHVADSCVIQDSSVRFLGISQLTDNPPNIIIVSGKSNIGGFVSLVNITDFSALKLYSISIGNPQFSAQTACFSNKDSAIYFLSMIHPTDSTAGLSLFLTRLHYSGVIDTVITVPRTSFDHIDSIYQIIAAPSMVGYHDSLLFIGTTANYFSMGLRKPIQFCFQVPSLRKLKEHITHDHVDSREFPALNGLLVRNGLLYQLTVQKTFNFLRVQSFDLMLVKKDEYYLDYSGVGLSYPVPYSFDFDGNQLLAGGVDYDDNLRPFALQSRMLRTQVVNAESRQSYTAYPNPVTDILNVPQAAGQLMSVYDQLGNLILVNCMDSMGRLDVSSLAPGVYFCKSVANPYSRSFKVMKR
jgi:hypothetical protein